MGLAKKKITPRTSDIDLNRHTRASEGPFSERQQMIRLTKRDWDRFLSLDRDVRPNRALCDAIERFKRSGL